MSSEMDVYQAGELMAVKSSTEVADFFSKLSVIQKTTKDMKVRSDAEEMTASECLAQIVALSKAVEAKRKSVVDPVNKFVTAVNGFFKTISSPLADAKGAIESKVMAFRNLKRIEAEKARQKAQAEADKINKKLEKAGIEAPPVQIITPQAQTVTRTEIGTTYTKTETKFEVTDLMELVKAVAAGTMDIAAIRANDTYIGALVKGGAREIPGVKVWEEQKIVTRSA